MVRGSRVSATGACSCSLYVLGYAGPNRGRKWFTISLFPEELCNVRAAVSKEEIEAFKNFCVLMRGTYEHIRKLSDDEGGRNLLHRAAPIFFGDLNRILIEMLILEVCRITDPASAGKFDNHTVEFLAKNADFSSAPESAARLRELCDAINMFRDKLKPARDKRISHLNRQTVRDRITLGAASDGEWNNFWLNLQEFLSIIYERYVGSPMKLNDVGLLSDIDGLFKQLRNGAYFDKMLHGADPVARDKCIKAAFGE